ncbi:MAG: hypothetical protein AAFO81_03755 [Pseudomonadota bacterium]
MLRTKITMAICIASLSAHALAETVRAPKGWNDTTADGIRVVSNAKATVRVHPWQHLGGQSLDAWLKEMEQTPPDGTRLISSGGVKRETVPGAYSVLRKVAFADSKGHAVLYACPGGNGYARLMTLDVVNGNFKDTFVGAMFGEKICKKAPKPTVVAQTVITEEREAEPVPDSPPVETTSVPVEPSVNPTPVPAASRSKSTQANTKAPDGLLELRGVIVMGIQPGGMFGITDDFLAMFDDGSYTEDLVTTFADGVQTSRRKNPKSWGTWRKRGDTVELREPGDNSYEKTRGTWRIAPSPEDYRLSGCFGRLNTSSGADYTSGTTVGVARTWCFWPDGRFTNSSTAFGSSSNASMRVSDKARGSYRIDGYVAHFVYDDGHTVTAAFGYASKDGNHLLLNGKRFQGAKR